MDTLRDTIAKIIGGPAFRPKHVSGDGLSPAEKEKWLRSRNIAYYQADQIGDALKARLAEPE